MWYAVHELERLCLLEGHGFESMVAVMLVVEEFDDPTRSHCVDALAGER